MQLPHWVTDPSLSDEQRQLNLIRLQIRLAAALHNREASLTQLSIAAGYSCNYLQTCLALKRFPQRAQLAVQSLVGREIFDMTLPEEI